MSFIKEAIKSILPNRVLCIIRRNRRKQIDDAYKNLTAQQVFTKIYEDGAWGKSNDKIQKYFSGSGSRNTAIVETYITAVRDLLSSFESKPNVVDLGCGDFSVGLKIRPLCNRYIACDIVQPLIDFNKEKYKNLDVDFRVIDLTKDDLPRGDVVFIRQVFQRLSNNQIKSALPQLASKFKYLVLTEHLPNNKSFAHNVDKRVGPGIRSWFGSGIVITSPPFNLKVLEQKDLCQAEEMDGVIKTTVYRLN